MDSLNVPPFRPTDEELITQYLWRKIGNSSFCAAPAPIGEVDLRRLDPWDFPGVSLQGGREWFFFSPRDVTYAMQNGLSRAAYSGYWGTTENDRQIFQGKTLVGMKRTMVFYQVKSPNIWNTNWSMHEYRLVGRNEWVICKVFLENKNQLQTNSISTQATLQTNYSISTKAIITPQPQYITKLWVNLEYNNDTVKFVLSNPTMDGLKTQVLMRFSKSESYVLKFMYKDEDGAMITIACDQDLQCCLEYFKLSGRIPHILISLPMTPLVAQQQNGLKPSFDYFI